MDLQCHKAIKRCYLATRFNSPRSGVVKRKEEEEEKKLWSQASGLESSVGSVSQQDLIVIHRVTPKGTGAGQEERLSENGFFTTLSDSIPFSWDDGARRRSDLPFSWHSSLHHLWIPSEAKQERLHLPAASEVKQKREISPLQTV